MAAVSPLMLVGVICTQAPGQSAAAVWPVAPERPLFGVIRWDGYNGGHFTQNQEFGFLKPEEHHWRAPWFVRRTGDPQKPLAFNPEFKQEIVQQVTDQEIRYAASCGIDFWAFCHFRKDKGDGWQLRNNLQAYLDSPLKPEINFALICIGEHVGKGIEGEESPEATWEDWRAYVREYIELMREPTYQTVLDGRPLWGIFGPSDLAKNLGDEEHAVDELKPAIQYLRDEVQAAGLADPYLVGMHAGGIWAARYVDDTGLDAVSAYRGCFGATVEGTPFRDLWANIRSSFLGNPDMGGTRKVIVPMVSGADQTPRHADVPKYLEPEPGDLARLLGSAFDYAVENPDQCEADATWIYAWNEHSEGGFPCPLMGDAPEYEPVTDQLDDCSRGIKNWVHPETRETLGTPLANYSFGDREPSLESIDLALASAAEPLRVPDGAQIVAGNNPRTARRGLCLRVSGPGRCEFAVAPPAGAGTLLPRAVAFAYRAGGGHVEVSVRTAHGEETAALGLEQTGEQWREVMISVPSALARATDSVTVYIDLQTTGCELDDIRLLGLSSDR